MTTTGPRGLHLHHPDNSMERWLWHTGYPSGTVPTSRGDGKSSLNLARLAMVDYTEWSTLRDDRLYGMVDSTGRDARDHNVSAGCNIRLGKHP